MANTLGRAGARGGFVIMAFRLAAAVLRFGGLILLARLIEPSIFGLVAIATTIALFASNITSLGLGQAMATRPDASNRVKSSLFYLNGLLGLICATGLFFIADPLAAVYDEPMLAVIFRWIALVPLLAGLQSQFRVQLMNDFRFFMIALSDFLSQALALGAAITLALLDLPYQAVVAQSVVQSLALLVILVAAAHWLPGRVAAWKGDVAEIVTIGAHVFGMNAARNLGRSALLPLVGLSVTPTALGSFDRAQQVAIMPVTMTADQLRMVAIPVLARLKDDREKMVAYLSRAQSALSYGMGLVFAVIAGVSVPLVDVLFGEGWKATGVVLGILAVGSSFRAVGNSLQWLFVATETTAKGVVDSVVLQPLLVGFSLLGLPWGIVGVAIANSVGWALYWPIITILAARATKTSPRALLVAPARGALLFMAPIAIVSFLVTHSLPFGDVARLLIGAASGLFVAAAVVAVLPPVRRDIRGVVDIVRMAGRGKRK